MAVYEIPTAPAPQTFLTRMGALTYRLRILYREVDGGLGGWILDIASNDGTPLVSGIPLVTGTDLLAPYAHLGFGGAMLVFTDGDPDAVPAFETLGNLTRLYFVTDAA